MLSQLSIVGSLYIRQPHQDRMTKRTETTYRKTPATLDPEPHINQQSTLAIFTFIAVTDTDQTRRMSTSEDFALSSENLAARDNGRGIAFHFFDAVDSGYSLRPGVIPTNFDVQQLQEMPNLPSPRNNLHESENNNAMRSPTIALCSCEGSPIATTIHLMAEMSSRDELKNRLRRQLVITIQQRDEYQRRDREAKAKVRMFERKAIVLRARVSALQPGQIPLRSGQISNNLMRASRQELREQARQYQMPIPIRTVRGSQNSAMRGHGDTLCSSCGQPLTSISIRLRAVMRSRQALKNTFRRQFALIIQQRDELRTRAREAEAKGRILERRHILMKAQVRAVHEAYLRDIQLGNLSNP